MSTAPTNPMSGILGAIGNLIAPDLGTQVSDAQQQLQLAFAALMGAQVVIIGELFIVTVLLWKHLRK